MPQDNDRWLSLLRRSSDGDENAFSELVSAFEKSVYNLALHITKNREDALDVSQEVFLKLWQKKSSFRGECSLNTYILRITHSTAIDLIRRKKRRVSLSLFDGDKENKKSFLDIPDEDIYSSPPAAFERDENIRAVRQAISALDTEQREIIVLRDMRGLSYDEISQILGIRIGTVKSRINRARLSLRKYLSKKSF